jgi:hypothetical protein
MTTYVFSEITNLGEFKTCVGEVGVVLAINKSDPNKVSLADVIPPDEGEVVGFLVDMDPRTREFERFKGALTAIRQSTGLSSK